MGFEGSSGWHGPSAGGGGGAIPLAQGEIYVDDNANTQTLTNQNTFYKLTAPTWSAGTNNGFTPNLGSQEIQCNGDGTYLVVCQGDIIAQNNEQIEFALFVNNVEQINFESLVTGRGGAQHSSWGYNGFVILSVGDIVDVTDGPGANQINLSKVWPNPATDLIQINTGNKTGKASIIDASGRVVKSIVLGAGINRILVNDMNRGLYMVTFNSNQGDILQARFLKQ